MFYRNLDQQNTYPVEDKFNNKQEFNQYRSQLKAYKKEREDTFKEQNGNYYFSSSRYNTYNRPERDSGFGGNPFQSHHKERENDNPFASTGGANNPAAFKRKEVFEEAHQV